MFDKNLFHKRFLSCYLHARKPDKKIYEIVLKQLRVRPEETVFIDDSKSNIKTAQSLGMKAVLFTSYPNLVKDLKRLSVL